LKKPYLFELNAETDRELEYARYSTALNGMFYQRLSATSLTTDNIVFVFVEAHALLETRAKQDCNFMELRRALTHFPKDKKMCCPLSLMTDTVAIVRRFGSGDRIVAQYLPSLLSLGHC
jgi:hypothetical protein